MKLKITEKGWGGYTGFLGQVEFVDGVSVADVGPGQAQMLGAIVRCEGVEDGINPSISEKMATMKARDAKNNEVAKRKEREARKAKPGEIKIDLTPYSKEVLEKIADEKGIKGVREIADQVGVVSKSVEDLIEKILVIRNRNLESGQVTAESQPAQE